MLKERFNISELYKLYPKSIKELIYFSRQEMDIGEQDIDFLVLLRFFDYKGYYIGISTDSSGKFWYVEISEIQIDCVSTRDEAEIIAVTECFEMIENASSKN